jgi:Na+/glutamate symporter
MANNASAAIALAANGIVSGVAQTQIVGRLLLRRLIRKASRTVSERNQNKLDSATRRAAISTDYCLFKN